MRKRNASSLFAVVAKEMIGTCKERIEGEGES